MNAKFVTAMTVTMITIIFLAIPLGLRASQSGGIPLGIDQYGVLLEINDAPSNPYHYLAGLFDNEISAAAILGPVFAVISFILLAHLLTMLKATRPLIALVVLLAVSTPSVIITFTTANAQSMAVACLLIILYLFIRGGMTLKGVAIALGPLLLMFGVFQTLLLAILMTAVASRKRNSNVILFGGLFLYLVTAIGYLLITPVDIDAGLLISDIGSLSGLGMVTAFLALIGLVGGWHARHRRKEIFAGFLFSAGSLIYFGEVALVYLSLFASVFAALAVGRMIQFRWEIKVVRNLTLFVVFLGLLFSTLSFYNRVAIEDPSPALVQTMQAMSTYPKGKVLSDPSRGHWISYYADQPAVVDPKSSIDLKNQVAGLFTLRNLATAVQNLTVLNVSYLWIDQDMREGDVWSREEEGFLFLLRSNETFELLHENEVAQIWKIR